MLPWKQPINTILGQVNFIRILSDISVASQRAHFWELLSSSLPCTRPPDKGIIRCLQLISNDIYPYSTSANSSKDSKLIPQKSQSLCSSHTLLPFRRPEFFPSRIPPFHSRIPSDLLLLSLCTWAQTCGPLLATPLHHSTDSKKPPQTSLYDLLLVLDP